MEKILLHACCAPCAVKCINTFKCENIDFSLFWYNPNIHPFIEYKTRKETLVGYAHKQNVELIMRDEYGLRSFISDVYPNFDKRCGKCYQMRLEAAAKYAAENGYSGFSTTLFISPYQNHEMLCAIGEKLAFQYKTSFFYRDFRPLFREGQRAAREMGLYMQKYCGCVFSEEERYKK